MCSSALNSTCPLFLAVLLLISFTTQSDTITGKVTRIVDGDTLVFLDQEKQQHRVRLAGIDTPERKQPFGKRATENQAQLAGNKHARLEWEKRDRYNRVIGKVLVGGVDINLQQVRDGLAWHYKRYAREQSR
ncbi:MAG: thermonuclease family protein [Sedimenticola sp.]